MIQEIRGRVRARHPRAVLGDVPLPDLLPLLHARDAAEGKVASIGRSIRARPASINSIVQSFKRTGRAHAGLARSRAGGV